MFIFRMVFFLGGKFFLILDLRCCNKKGFSILCNCWIILCWLFLFEIWNYLLNVLVELKILGRRKFKRVYSL